MGFKKQRIGAKKSSFLLYDADAQFFRARRRNLFSGLVLGLLALLFLLFFGATALSHIPSFDVSLQALRAFVPAAGGVAVAKPEKSVINVLLIGRGGVTNDAPDLTDTIILASLNFEKGTASFFSIPRDLYVEYPTGGRGKVNETYLRAYKKEKSVDAAMRVLGEKVTEITGEPIDHYVGVDFGAFVKIVDIVGGITVDVPEDLVDREYPDGNWGYMTFRVKAGVQTFDGATALKYARSRHSTSDFDRSLRQQAILRALRERVFQAENLTDPKKLEALYAAVRDNIVTDLSIQDILYFASFARSLDSTRMLSFNLNDTCLQSHVTCQRGGLLYSPMRDLFGGLSVLLPATANPSRVDDYSEIRVYANLAVQHPDLYIDRRPVVVVNATRVGRVASQVALILKKYGFDVPDRDALYSTRDTVERSYVAYSTGFAAGSGASATGAEAALGTGLVADIAARFREASRTGADAGSPDVPDGGADSAPPDDPTLAGLASMLGLPAREILPEERRYATGTSLETVQVVVGKDYQALLQR